MKTIGFFGGSFDPVHFGHVNLAVEMLEKADLDEVLFCPAFCSPFKTHAPPASSGEHRFRMLELALSGVPRCRVTPIEIEKNAPSFTVETLRKLQAPGLRFKLILSDEAAAAFEQWREPQEILRMAPLLIGARAGGRFDKKGGVQTRVLEISSTEIRARLKEKKYCAHLVPQIVLDYIEENNLYFV